MPTWTKEQNDAIVQTGSNIIVSAGAGSGKTAVLSERVIDKLSHGIHVDELLILTFTRAAAEEMKDRIRKKIKKNADFKEELDRIDSAYITTFDSFALSVVKRYHYLLNVPKDIQIADDSIVKIQKKHFMDETFLDLYKDNNQKFLEFIKKYCLKSDASIRKSVLNLANKMEGYIDKDRFIFELENTFFEDDNINKIINEYLRLLEEKKKIVSLELENFSHYFDSSYVMKVETMILPIINIQSIDDLISYSGAKLPAVPRGSDDESKKVKEKLNNALKELLALAKFGNESDIKNSIISTQKNVFVILDIIKKYSLKLSKYKNNNNIYTFNDVAALAIKVLNEYPEAALELKNHFKEIMIDEYQDTNDVQETFISKISNNNVYMVGDIKQSIYRFRGSNPNIFKEKYDNYSKKDGGFKIDLIKNFRSREEVLDNINRIFDLLMDNELGGAEYYESHEMIYGNHSYDDKKIENYNYDFEVLEYQNDKASEYSNAEIEIFTIANDIKEKIANNMLVFDKDTSKMRKAEYSDFVIILDRSKYFDDFKKIFEYMNMPLTILKDDKLNASNDILIIKNIIDFIIRINNKDFGTEFKYDFMSIGRSFLYEYTDDYLFTSLTQNKIFETDLFKDFSNIKNFNTKTSSILLNEILDITDFYDKINKIGDYENINVRISCISDLASNLNGIGLGPIEFRDYLNEIVENNYDIKYTSFRGNQSSVKILTIHKSKGLEYPVCYFADLDHNFNTMELKDQFICDRNYGLILDTDTEDDNGNIIKLLYKNYFMKEEIGEKIRLFYVALTRAREKMIMVLPTIDTEKLEKNENGVIELTRRLKFTKLSNFLYAVKAYLPKYFLNVDLNKLNLTKNYLYAKDIKQIEITQNFYDFEVRNLNIETSFIEEAKFSKSTTELLSKETIKNMQFGTKIHEMFEFIDFKNYDSNLIEDEFFRNKITNFINNPLLKDVSLANIYHEYEFEYTNNNKNMHGIIDLMLEYSDHIDIIDFKLKNTVDEHYIEQIIGYKKYINEITNKPIFTYLYSIIDGEFKKI